MKRIWECWNCGHIFEFIKKPHTCPKCLNAHIMSEEVFFIELPQARKPEQECDDDRDFYPLYNSDQILTI